MREEVVGEARRSSIPCCSHTRRESSPRAEKNSSAAKLAFFPVRCRRTGKDTGRAPVRGTIALTYRTIINFAVLF